ncbi:hypothetical protein N9235_03495 [Gammaproteobacteria bacterium]|nr:hypothetical protein [Gammaproteobacteria bacterium]
MKTSTRVELLAAFISVGLFISGCGPIPVSVGEHEVTPDVDMKETVSLTNVMVSAPLDAIKVNSIADTVEMTGLEVEIVNGTQCMATFLADGSESLPLPISRFLEPDYRSRVTHLAIDYIIILGEEQTDSRKTEIVTTVINYSDLTQTKTAQIHAEGKMRAFWPILPYVALFVFYSEPDTQIGMADALGSVVSQIILSDEKSTRPRILFLESDNLVEMTRSVPRFVADSNNQKQPAAIYNPNPVENPVALYKTMIGRGEGWDEDDPITASMPYNPLAHAIAIPTVIMLSPMLWVINKIPVSPQSSRWDFLIYSEKAIKRQDWEAAYRWLEDGLVSADDEIKYQSHEVLNRYPEIMEGAKESFTEKSFKETLSKHGDAAFKLEEQRLAIYRTVASPLDYADAEQNFARVFSEQNNDDKNINE